MRTRRFWDLLRFKLLLQFVSSTLPINSILFFDTIKAEQMEIECQAYAFHETFRPLDQ